MSHRTAIFSKLVRDYARGDVVAVARDTSLGDTIARMAAAGLRHMPAARMAKVIPTSLRRPMVLK